MGIKSRSSQVFKGASSGYAQNISEKNIQKHNTTRKKILYVHPFFKIGNEIPELDEMFDITYTNNGVEALQSYYKNKGKYDIIISGIVMAKMDGFSFISKMRKITKKAEVFMLIDSEEIDEKTKSFFKELNVKHFLSINFRSSLEKVLLLKD